MVLFIWSDSLLFAQDDCIQTRWTEIRNYGPNSAVFGETESAQTLVDHIRGYVLDEGLMIYEETAKGIHYETVWNEIDTVQYIVHLGDTIRTTRWKDYFTYTSQIQDPLDDEFSMQNIIVDLDQRHLLSLRIREEHMSTEERPEPHFELTGIALVTDNGSPYFEAFPLFWISVFELKDLIEDQEIPFWLDALDEGNFTGFQYMQRPCVAQ
ncbi:MAG: hypothetical protein A3D92_16960 [Bacteroidetes bacterium RIFCSPHIGHO2_02_FULL_44_7]|nr:MAG: hypothetical protein A3D92_16960 [Bacteroidetes bacterium RIFCSPHIGHO2_02_FULL_44_7]